MAQSTATMKRGCRAISASGRPPERSAACGGNRADPLRKVRTRKPSTASPAVAKKAPANGIGARRSWVRIAVCGPMIAAAMPPDSTHEIAFAWKAGLPPSAAAKRYCWAKAAESPVPAAARTNPANDPPSTAKPLAIAARTPMIAPARKPSCRPTARISIAAGNAPRATPTVNAESGSVASDLSGPSRYMPASPPRVKRTGGMAPLTAAAIARMSALRRCSRSSTVADTAAGKFMTRCFSERDGTPEPRPRDLPFS